MGIDVVTKGVGPISDDLAAGAMLFPAPKYQKEHCYPVLSKGNWSTIENTRFGKRNIVRF
jgi:hypothetical protein